MLDGGLKWIGGFAIVCGGFSVGNAMALNAAGEDRVRESATVLAHEIAHSLGAKHTSTYGLLYPAPMPLRMWPLPVEAESQRQIARCRRRAYGSN